MAVQVQTATGIEAKLNVTWDLLVSCRAVSLQIAADSEFTERVRTFVLPPEATAVTLDNKIERVCHQGERYPPNQPSR